MAAEPSEQGGCRFDAATTCAAAQVAMRRAFIDAGVDTPDLDARLLLCGVLGLDAARLITAPQQPLGDGAGALTAAALRRISREPVSRILGQRDFYGRTFEITPATLDPRPDTETVVDAVLGYVDTNGGRLRPWRILDVGTGSGCLLISLLAELPNATGLGSDISADALEVAARNGYRNGVAARMSLLLADGLAGIAGPFDMLVSNPPYIPSAEIELLAPEVSTFDPMLALDGGGDGLAFYRRLISRVSCVISTGYVCFEVGHDQAAPVAAMFAESGHAMGWPAPEQFADLGGNVRCVAQTTRR
ncbi:MAG: peptide chain release factor N(5)-glutamine methyltransferase [Hyphomicrobiaceae bacterium]